VAISAAPSFSPYNTPILAVHKGPNKWRLVQDLWLIDEAAIPLHPIVPNPYTLLFQICRGGIRINHQSV
jgi:hypothetical protein